MSEINPDFSFPLPLPQSLQRPLQQPLQPPMPSSLPPSLAQPIPQLPTSREPSQVQSQLQLPAHDGRPLSFSPRPKRHAHRRSAAMSEDLSAVELATLTSSPKPPSVLNSPKSISSPKPGPLGSFNTHLPPPSSLHAVNAPPAPSSAPAPSSSVQPLSSQSVSQPASLQAPQPASQQAIQSPLQSPIHTPPLQSPKLAPQRTPMLGSAPIGIVPSTPDGRSREHADRGEPRLDLRDRPLSGFRSPSSRPIGEPGWLVPTPVVSPAPVPTNTTKHRKRRSFVQMFKRSSDEPEEAVPAAATPARAQTTGPTKAPTVGPTVGPTTAPASAPVPAMAPTTAPTAAPSSPQSDSFDDADDTVVAMTPRNMSQPEQPKIDLDEALGCSFSQRPPDHAPDPLLESPFSKTSSSGMGAVLEEDEDEDTSEVDSLFSVSRQRRRPASFLHASLPAGSPRFSAPPPALSIPGPSSLPSSAPIASQFSQGRTISYVGPVLQPPSPTGSMQSRGSSRASSRSPSRSPRVSFEQVSNLAISDPPTVNPSSNAPQLAPRAAPVPSEPPFSHTKPAKGHRRRRSLIDRLIRR